MPPFSTTPIHFGKFIVTSHVFHQTPLTIAFVNLKPLLPGHVLVSPRRIVPRLADLTQPELTDLFTTVQSVGKMVERVYQASALNIAMQDGLDAGQSVPHVHMHIIPRKAQDLEDDAIYGMLEGEEGDVGGHLEESAREARGEGKGLRGERPKMPKVDEESRKPRSEEVMREEAEGLRSEMEREGEGGRH
ncbi:hypothetical protein MMC10_008657 [Thelotrema lepadinum]|nr:hypothetical protein [Thelotrema lepadinum]